MKLRKIESTELSLFKDDPVRPHIDAHFRTSDNREVYVLDSGEKIDAVICVGYTTDVPTNEQDLEYIGDDIAVFYTVWSYSKGAGRDIVFKTAAHIKENKPSVKRYVTLSPLTEMARKFHLRNGAEFVARHLDCQNFEYTI